MRQALRLKLAFFTVASTLLAPVAGAQGGLTSLGSLGGFAESEAYGINASGQVVGFAWNQGSTGHAFLWSPASGMQDLGTLPGYGMSHAWGINDLGWVVGESWVFGQEQDGVRFGQAFFWSSQTGMFGLAPLSGFGSCVACDVNNAGQVVGYSYGIGQDSFQPTLWDASGPHSLGTLSGFSSAIAARTNSAGRVIGWAFSPGGTARRAFIR